MRPSISRSVVALAISVAVCVNASPLSTPFDEPQQRSLLMAPIVEADHPHGTINNSYIVVFKDSITPALMYNHLDFLERAQDEDATFADDDDAGLSHVYDGLIKGYAGRFSPYILDQIRAAPEVAYVERDQIVRIQKTQYGAPWVNSFFPI
jgi:cerevisin